ncbi:hypothetical protein OPV22_013564 [Ensete ventricosum]|uniref:Uncharacterized protein n=1 Tax=Ensete ventricosum TaxID=4639 RepID=A0AAV8PIS0_ENSVE|nr:hypothetical protein OPV22_013564 [Ensete ventricosum]
MFLSSVEELLRKLAPDCQQLENKGTQVLDLKPIFFKRMFCGKPASQISMLLNHVDMTQLCGEVLKE